MSHELLSVAAYNAFEREASDWVSNRALQAAHTESFNKTQFPTACHGDGGVWKFGETMHEHSQHWIWDQILRGLTQDECEALKELNRDLLPRFTGRYHRRVQAGNAFLGPLSIGRHITHMFPGRRLRILEIGAGSGYLSWYLARAGHQVITVDVSQGFYLYQNHLLRTAYGDGFVELAGDPRSLSQCLQEAPEAQVIHLPWWKYYALYEGDLDWSVDIFISEANLTEMTEPGWQYAVWLARKTLDRSNPFRFFGFRDWGYQANFRHMDIWKEFRKAGFALPFTDNKFNVFAYCEDAPPVDPTLEHLADHYRATYPDWRRMNNLPPEVFSFHSEKWRKAVLTARLAAEAKIVLEGKDFATWAERELGLTSPGGQDQRFADFIHLA